MLFQTKLAEIHRHLAYIRRECAARSASAHANLAARLQSLLTYINDLERDVRDLDARLIAYQPAANPAFDTWKQLFSELSTLARAAQVLRTLELPIYLAAAPDDHFLSNVVEALLREVGIASVHPIALLYQDEWFAVNPMTGYPLFYIPASIVADPSELPLVLHEFGHVLFRLWDPQFPQHVADVVTATVARKKAEALNQTNPAVANNLATIVTQWERQAYAEIEEVTCDVVGCLLGGQSFVAALMVGLLAISSSPFVHRPNVPYPPIDCRMRIGGLVLRRRGLDGPLLDQLESGWARVQAVHTLNRPAAYGWLYDDRYLGDVIAAVEEYLLREGVSLYVPGCGGLRECLDEGATSLLDPPPGHENWVANTLTQLRQDHAPPQP